MGKLLEKVLLDRHEGAINNNQSGLQRGFIKRVSPIYASLLLSEAIAEAKDCKKPLYAAFIDASKAFDVVWLSSMLCKLHKYGIDGACWMLLHDWYQNLSSKVKWCGQLSEPFPESQGVRQWGSQTGVHLVPEHV